MFDYSVEGLAALTGAQLAAAVSENHAVQVTAEDRTLLLAASWADLHSVDADRPYAPLVERASVLGGAGTPEVSEFACLELGALLGVGMVTGRALLADALDLRHRFPILWHRVLDGQVRAWKARQVAQQTRHLSWDAAADVDLAVAGLVETLPWSRFAKVLTAAIVDADPELAAEREMAARARREVYATTSEDGLKTIIARATTGDAIIFMATVNRIADILATDDHAHGRTAGTADSVDVRRSRAIGILAQPARALQLLLAHRHDPDPDPHEATATTGPSAEDEPPASDLIPDRDTDGHPDGDDVDSDGYADTACEERLQAETPTLWLPDLPAGLDPAQLAPRVVLHFHLSDMAIRDGHGLARPDDHSDPISLDALKDWLADTGCPITIRPILDPSEVAAVDRYEIPTRMRAALAVRNLADVFPYGSLTKQIDIDHTQPYQPNGPPGQTRLGNLGPLSRTTHRAATVGPRVGRWRKRQPDPGLYLWRSPHGWIWLVTNQGTLNLGNTPYSRALWRAAAPAQACAA